MASTTTLKRREQAESKSESLTVENKQLGKVVLFLKGLERNSNMEDEKWIFDFKYSEPLAFTQEKVVSINF